MTDPKPDFLWSDSDLESDSDPEPDPSLEPLATPSNANIDIVFVYVRDDSHVTGTGTGDDTFWPRDLLPKDLPNARIFSFGYPTSKLDEPGWSNSLTTQLRNVHSNTDTRPTILLVDGFGLYDFIMKFITKWAFTRLCIRSIAFFRPLHEESEGLEDSHSRAQILESLQRMSPRDKQYVQLVFFEKIQAGKSIVPLRLETSSRALEDTVNDEDFARRSDRSNTQLMQKYHLSACHFDDKEDGNYQNVIKLLRGWMERNEILYRQGFQKSQLGTTDGGILHPKNEIDSEFLDRQIRVHMSDIAANLYTRIYAEILCHTKQTMLDESLMGKVVHGLPILLQDFALRLDMVSTDRDAMILVHNYQHAISQTFNEINSGSDTTFYSVRDNKMDNDDYLSELNKAMETIRDDRCRIYRAKAYTWLLYRLRREFLVASTTDNATDEISRTIIGSLPEIKQVHLNSPSEKYTMTFQVNCNPRDFIERQQFKGSTDVKKILHSVLTLTGSADDVQALTIEQYMKKTWFDGRSFYSSLTLAIAFQEGDEPHRYSKTIGNIKMNKLLIWLRDSMLIIRASGPRYYLAEIGQQLAWIGGVFQTPEHSDESRVTLYTPSIIRIPDGHDPLSALSVVKDPGISWNVQYKEDSEDIGPDLPNGRCWFNLLRNPVVVQGFPILRKPEPILGFEASLDVITEATQATHITTFNGRTFINGNHTILVLERQEPGLVIWHLLWNSGYTRNSYLDPRIQLLRSDAAKDLESLAHGKLRHVVGWCEKAEIRAGAPSINYLNIDMSGLRYLGTDCTGHIQASMSAPVRLDSSNYLTQNEKANNAKQGHSTGYFDRILPLTEKTVVIYDVGDKRAWLIDAASALLHLVRTAVEDVKTSTVTEHCVSPDFKIAEYGSEGSTTSSNLAFSVLKNETNQSMKLFEGDSEQTFKTLVEKLECILDMGFDQQKLINQNLNCRKHLGGFEFKDMIQDTRDIEPRFLEMNLDGSWFDLTKKLKAIILFGKGFGELIEAGSPMCEGWKAVPKNMNYLAVRISDTIRPLGEDMSWHIPMKNLERCPHHSNSCDHAQYFLDRQRNGSIIWESSKELEEGNTEGTVKGTAVIFKPGKMLSSHPSEGLSNSPNEMDSKSGADTTPGRRNIPSLCSDSTKNTENHDNALSIDSGCEQHSVSGDRQASPEILPIQEAHNEHGVVTGNDRKPVGTRTESVDIHIPWLILLFALVVVPLDSSWLSLYYKTLVISSSLTWFYYDVFISKLSVQQKSNLDQNSRGTSVKDLVKWAIFTAMLLWLFILSPAHIFVPTLLDFWTPYDNAPTHKPSEVLYDRGDFSFGDISVDVFAIHGLGSNSSSAWTDRETNVQWLRDILPRHKQLNKIRVITLNHQTKWAFEVSAKTLRDHAIEMLREIDYLNQGRRPIIFIAHSFGGLLLKQALVLSLEESKRVSRMTRGIMFLGTPHRGSPTAFIGRLLACSAYWRGSSDVLLKYMSRNNDKLNDLDRDFRERYRPLRSTPEHGPIYIGNFLENRVERFQKVSLSATVDKEHGSLDYVEDVFLDTDHRGLNKFRSPDDPNFKIFLLHFMRAFDYCKYSS